MVCCWVFFKTGWIMGWSYDVGWWLGDRDVGLFGLDY
jgi:hypothetical protein